MRGPLPFFLAAAGVGAAFMVVGPFRDNGRAPNSNSVYAQKKLLTVNYNYNTYE